MPPLAAIRLERAVFIPSVEPVLVDEMDRGDHPKESAGNYLLSILFLLSSQHNFIFVALKFGFV